MTAHPHDISKSYIFFFRFFTSQLWGLLNLWKQWPPHIHSSLVPLPWITITSSLTTILESSKTFEKLMVSVKNGTRPKSLILRR